MQTEINLQTENEKQADQRVKDVEIRHEAIKETDILAQQLEVDSSIELDTDLFNAATVSIKDMKDAIDKDDSIENKTLELFTRLKNRHELFQERIFQRNKANTVEANSQRSIQQYFNEFSNRLRESEREALRLQDLTYKPRPPVKPKKAKVPGKKKYDRAELARVAEETNMAASSIQALCVALNLQPKDIPAHLEKLKEK